MLATGKLQRWTSSEEEKMQALVTELGTGKWGDVAEQLATGRTAAGVEQHW